jgi:hypothetical protein
VFDAWLEVAVAERGIAASSRPEADISKKLDRIAVFIYNKNHSHL